MNIDWSKAPEGFPIWLEYLEPAMEGDKERRQAGGEWVRDSANRYETVRGTYWSKPEEGYYVVHSLPAWDGEGAPPVGTVCEFKKFNAPPACDSEWMVGDIRYFSECTVIIGGDRCEHVHHPANCAFRPLLTPEQIAEQKRENAVKTIIQDSMGRCDIVGAGYLYEAGYRKEIVQ